MTTQPVLKHLLATFLCLASSASAQRHEYDFPKMIQPVPLTAKFEDPGFIVWCGSVVRDDQGKYHMLYSRWPRELGHYAWVTHSEVAHAVADHPSGPYKFAGVALPARGREFWDGLCTHNPTVMKFGGKYYLYYMGNTGDGKAMPNLNWSHRNNQRIGVAVADHPSGPWTRQDTPLIAPTPGFHDALCLANPSVTRRPDGGYLMVYKAVGDKGKKPFGGPVVHVVATSDHPTGPFTKHPDPVFTSPESSFAAEDPYIWHGAGRYWAIVKDFNGHFTKAGPSLALFDSSDGFRWRPAAHPLVSRLQVQWADGKTQKLVKLERPQLLMENGEPRHLLCAAAPVGNLNASFGVQIPLAFRQQDPPPPAGSLLPGNPEKWKLVWSEEFDGPDQELEKHWESQNGPSGHILSSRWRENVRISDGTLKLINRKERRGGQEWTSGNIWTKRHFQYGYFECRYRYAAAKGTNNSFWIMTRGTPPPGKKAFEIDINEGHYPAEINTNIHNHSDVTIVNGRKTHPTSSKSFNLEDGKRNFARDFHTYGLEWTEEELVFYFDGREIRREKNHFCHHPAPVWLSLAIISWAGNVTDSVDRTQMEVDYVRIYEDRTKPMEKTTKTPPRP